LAEKTTQFVLPGYQLINRIYESSRTLVFRTVQEDSKRPVILKVLKSDCRDPEVTMRYQQEYEIARHFDSAEVVRVYELTRYLDKLVLVMEDCGGQSLDHWLIRWGVAGNAAFSIHRFLKIARKTVDGLAQIHAAGFMHKDISSANIVYNQKSEKINLIDFGLATSLHREMPIPRSPYVLEGSLAYLSPEQTGRMNRTIDYRSDFYSLGVTLYELLTGRLPFEMTDAMELIHAHLARVPSNPTALNPNVPSMLSKLVLKLMAKNPEARYQLLFR
jgi:serine/threonine protein kinase